MDLNARLRSSSKKFTCFRDHENFESKLYATDLNFPEQMSITIEENVP